MISNQSTAESQAPQAARQAALNSVLRRLVAVPPPSRNGAPPPRRPTPPVAPPPHAPVPRWLTTPVLQLAVPDSPLAAGTVTPPQPAPAPPPPPKPQPEAPASEVFDVPPLVEPIAGAKPEPPRDLPARNMSEIAAIVAQAPEAIAPVAVDLSALATLDAPAPPAAAPAAAAAAAAPQTAPVPRTRTEPARRVTVRRARPRVAHPQRRITAPRPTAKSAAGAPAAKPARPGRAAAPQPVPQPAPQTVPSAKPAPVAKAPASARPALAPAATAVVRTVSTSPSPAAVPETRPLTQNRRLYRRVRLTAELEVAGKPCRLIDLSIGGFAAAGADRLDPGAVVPVTLRMTIDGINIGTQLSARMVYGNGARTAGRFVDLTGAQTAFLRYIVTWRGEAIGAVGTTTLLDAITRWPERALQPHPSTVKPPEPERPGFWSRLVGRIPLLGWRKRS